MKNLIFITLFLFSLFGFAQDQKVYIKITCEDGIKQAVLDASKGKYKLISYGLTISFGDDFGFGEFYSDFIYKKFGIQFSDGGCVIMPDTKCYKEKIKELIFEKYGEDVFIKAKVDARNMFKETSQYKDIVKKKIDSGYVFSSILIHEEPEFLGGEEELEVFLGRSLNPDYFQMENYIYAYFTIEKDGSVNDIELRSALNGDKLNNKESKEIFDLLIVMPKWKPGKYFDEFVRTRVSLSIVIK
jgi:disulfide oxidoreductase YuzD